MTRSEFAARIKSKYPDYRSLDDETLVTKILAKYPDYASQIDGDAEPVRTGPPGPMGKYGGLPGAQANLEQTAMERFGQDVGALGEDVRGYASGLTNTITGKNTIDPKGTERSLGGRIGATQADTLIGAGKAAIGTGADIADLLSGGRERGLTELVTGEPGPKSDFRAALEPQNTPQQIGHAAERMFEFVVPAGAVGKFATGMKTGRALKAGVDIAGNIGVSLGIDAMHGEDEETTKMDAVIAGAIPLVGHTLGAGLKGTGKAIIDRFFPQTKTETKLRISKKSTSSVLEDEGIRGLRGQTLLNNIEETTNALEASLANKIVASGDAGGVGKGATASVLPKIENLFVRGKSVAKARTEGEVALNAMDEGLTSIKGEINRMKGAPAEMPMGAVVADASLNARQLNNLRKHINVLLKKAPPGSDTYRRTLLDAHQTVKAQLEKLAPGARAELSRISELIGTQHNIEQRLGQLARREPVTATDIGTGALTALSPAVGGPVVAVKVAHKSWQYTPGRMAMSNALQAMGGLSGRTGMGAYFGAKNTDGVEQPEGSAYEPPVEQTAPAPGPLQDPNEQRHFDASMPVVSEYDDAIERAAEQAGIDSLLLKALVIQESGALGPTAKSKRGAYGLTQVMRPALEDLGMQDYDLTDPEVQLVAGAKYLKRLLDHYNGNMTLALAAYNGGMGNVKKAGGVPNNPETRAYVPKVLRYYVALGGTQGEPTAVGGL